MIKFCPNCASELKQSGGVKLCTNCEGKYYILETNSPKEKPIEPIKKQIDYMQKPSKWIEINECPKCNSKDIRWYLSSTKECNICKCVFRAEELID